MYLTPLKTLLTTAMRETFDQEYINPDYRDTLISIEFPVQKQEYPSIWVDFEPTGELEVVGIDHREYINDTPDSGRGYSRWRYQGFVTYTVVALQSLERDDLVGEVIRVMAFGREADSTSDFRTIIEDNPFIACNIDFDQIGQRGFSASPGTPWGTDEYIYEGTLAMEVVGEFVSSNATGELVRLDRFEVHEYSDQETEPPWPTA